MLTNIVIQYPVCNVEKNSLDFISKMRVTHSQRIKDIPAHERPRERLAEKGSAALRDAELVAIARWLSGARDLASTDLASTPATPGSDARST